MKLSVSWLHEWVQPGVDATTLAAKLNMAGLECEAEPLCAELPQGVVVARILSAAPHPQADRLQVCTVDAGTATPLQIVCGAANARPGLRIPAALPGARLPGGLEIKQAALRGVESSGMLCSASELGLAEKSEGLLELAGDAPVGTDIVAYLGLRDELLNLELTPNRGDCLSILGTAREVAALYGVPLHAPALVPADVGDRAEVAVTIDDPQACTHYVGRAVSGLNAQASTPDWMRERLRRSGIRSIHPVVDITNYVMLELGQPMHAFDRGRLQGRVHVRRARAGETLKLLNEQSIELHADDVLIADDARPLVLAGIMGGVDSGVSAGTTDIFLEAACFDAIAIAHSGRRHKLLSDSRYRNERGVDPALQRMAIERATALILQLCGGRAGPIVDCGPTPAHGAEIVLRHRQVQRLLGYDLAAGEVAPLLTRLGIAVEETAPGVWKTYAPTWRHDLRIEADLVEEVGRLYGYEHIPPRAYAAALAGFMPAETERPRLALSDLLVGRGYREVVTYSFVDPKLQNQLDPEAAGLAVVLDNPIAETLSTMRTSTWSGLLATWLYNRQRQAARARLFEIGACYYRDGESSREIQRLGGLLAGEAGTQQWAVKTRDFDFYDAKADVEALLGGSGWTFTAAVHPALHPGRSARILRDGAPVGWLGALHPRLAAALDAGDAVYLYELDWQPLATAPLPQPQSVSEFPASRRDLSLILPESVDAAQLLATVRAAAGALLNQALIFDVYRGVGVPEGRKSIAIGLIFQAPSRTLNDEEIDAATADVVAKVSTQLGASVRG